VTFTELSLPGVYVIDCNSAMDERGSFARTFCREEFAAHGLSGEFVQSGIAHNKALGTLRGLHYQREPYWEEKLVLCVAGAIYDVIVDLRTSSPTHCRWVSIVLTSAQRRCVYIPKGCAHGYLTLVDGCDVLYQISQYYQPAHSAGVRWDDSAFGVIWPVPARVISARDQSFPDYRK
jgi:dTDP-4-dehydrorhamnose 3,5-epimerase